MESRKVGPWKVYSIYRAYIEYTFQGPTFLFLVFCDSLLQVLNFYWKEGWLFSWGSYVTLCSRYSISIGRRGDYLVEAVMWLSAPGIQFLLDGGVIILLESILWTWAWQLAWKVESGWWKVESWKVESRFNTNSTFRKQEISCFQYKTATLPLNFNCFGLIMFPPILRPAFRVQENLCTLIAGLNIKRWSLLY